MFTLLSSFSLSDWAAAASQCGLSAALVWSAAMAARRAPAGSARAKQPSKQLSTRVSTGR